MSKKTKELLTIQLSLKEFFKRHEITKIEPKDPNIASFTKKVMKSPKRLLKEDQILSHFLQDCDQSKYYELQPIEDLDLMKIVESPDKKQCVVMFFASRFPQDKKMEEKTYFYFIENMLKVKDKPYYFWYFHSKNAKHTMFFLKTCYKKIPIKFIFNLERLYLIHAGLLAKSSFHMQSGYHAKQIKKKSKYLKDFSKLFKDSDFDKDFLTHIPEEICGKSEESFMISHLLPKHQEIMGVALESLPASDNGVPEVLTTLISYFDINRKHIKAQGIFRCTAGEKDIKRLEKSMVEHDLDYLFDIENPHVVSSLLKRILNKSKDPLLLFENYDEIVMLGSINFMKNPEDLKKKVKTFVKEKLPKFNYRVFSFLIAFLRKVIKKKQDNLMDSFNISMVFAPCFVRPKTYTADDIKKTADVINFLKFVLENYESLFEERFHHHGSSESEENQATFQEFTVDKPELRVEKYSNEVSSNNFLKSDMEDSQIRKHTTPLKHLHENKNLLSTTYRKVTDITHSDFEGKKKNESKSDLPPMVPTKKKSSKKTAKNVATACMVEEYKEDKK